LLVTTQTKKLVFIVLDIDDYVHNISNTFGLVFSKVKIHIHVDVFSKFVGKVLVVFDNQNDSFECLFEIFRMELEVWDQLEGVDLVVSIILADILNKKIDLIAEVNLLLDENPFALID